MGRELPTNLVWRGRKIYLRVRVPEDVRHAFGGKEEVWKSLGTGDEKRGRALGRQKLAELENDWQRVRDTVPVPASFRDLTDADIQQHAAALYDSELRHDAEQRLRWPTREHIEAERQGIRHLSAGDPARQIDRMFDFIALEGAANFDRGSRAKLLAELKRHLGTGETTLVQWAADAALSRDNLVAERGSVPYRRLCQALTRAWIEAIERTLERDRGDFAGRPADPIVTAPVPPSPHAASVEHPPGETVMDLFERYARANPRRIKPDTLDYSRVIIEQFAGTLPEGAHVSAVTKKAVREWHDLLRMLPIRSTDLTAFRGKSMREIIILNETLGKPLISGKTINKYLSALGGFCVWLESREHVPSNPVKGLYDRLDKSQRKVRPYNADELRSLFASPLFTGHAGKGKEHLPGAERSDDWCYWLPWLALYTGARLGELAQLHIADLRQQDGHWVFDITEEGGGKSLKTKDSRRVVPIHHELIRLGLLRFHADQARKGHARLFPEIQADPRGFMSGSPSKWFRSYFKRIGLKEDKSTNFHSFRHCAADAFRRAGYMDHEFGFLLGHASQATKITRGYGSLSEGDLERRKTIIESISFATDAAR